VTESLTAFAALQELARLQPTIKEIQQNAPMLRAAAQGYRNQAAGCELCRPKDALVRAAAVMEETAAALEDVLAVVHEEGKCLEEKLTAVAVKQADLDEIYRRRKSSSAGQKAADAMAEKLKQRGTQINQSASGIWTVGGTGTSTT
jgi:predicted  nucleic acid-binding Zn-ribbon protein